MLAEGACNVQTLESATEKLLASKANSLALVIDERFVEGAQEAS